MPPIGLNVYNWIFFNAGYVKTAHNWAVFGLVD
ncbi:hypothetical protein GGR41_001685 [Paenalcaligenes hominis]|uniref:Uncharacterized protein n=1 Tax=Paenalcaligenes hominis TaxID=643674 RepID=A0ABX0WRQ0_9BURK|nr:hypothetical protein [Paenalcaligenes hominis]